MALLKGSVAGQDQPGPAADGLASGFGLNPVAEHAQVGLGTSGSRSGTVRVYGRFMEG
jgi:hypothetical protein